MQAMVLRVLIVDDNVNFLGVARDLLEREGVAVVGVASTSAQALQLARTLHPEVILVDVDLGEESGFDLAQRLAASEVGRIVLISAYPEADFADLITASPAVGFVSKSELSATAVADVVGNGGNSGVRPDH
jgi:two-component system, NarL family, nitrate/nitrite response regulator NarL